MTYILIALLGVAVLLSCCITGRRTESDSYGNWAVLADCTGFLPLPDAGLLLAERTTLGGMGCDVDLRRLAVEEPLAVIELRENDFFLLPLQEISEVGLQVLRGETTLTPFGSEPLRLRHDDCLLVNGTPALHFFHC